VGEGRGKSAGEEMAKVGGEVKRWTRVVRGSKEGRGGGTSSAASGKMSEAAKLMFVHSAASGHGLTPCAALLEAIPTLEVLEDSACVLVRGEVQSPRG
jgi:hypothetical protein